MRKKSLFRRIFDTECERSLGFDALLVAVATLLGVVLFIYGGWQILFSLVPGAGAIKVFVTGIFFTSGFTTPIALSAFAALSGTTSPVQMALFGGLGAVAGDLILFLFVRDRVSRDLMCVLGSPRGRRFTTVFKRRIFKWVVPFLGALMIASPLPDELAVSMIGLSRVPLYVMLPLSFTMNALGIYVVALLA